MASTMPPLPVLAVALTVGVLLGSECVPDRGSADPLWAAAWLALLLALCAAMARGRTGHRRSVALATAGLCAGGLAAPSPARLAPDLAIGDDRTIEAEVCGLDRNPRELELTLCDAVEVGQGVPLGKLLVLVDEPGPADAPVPSWQIGRVYRLGVRLIAHGDARNPGAHTGALAARLRRGVAGRARLLDAAGAVRRPDLERRGALERALYAAHTRLLETRTRLAGLLVDAGPGGSLVSTLALGMRGGAAGAQREAFARLGIAHVLAVSGLHLALVIGGAHFLLGRAARGLPRLLARFDVRPATRLAAVLCGCAYACLCGFGLPMQRALIFAWAWLIGTFCARRIGALRVLACAVVVLVWLDPAAVFDPGAHLSFAAAGALLLARRAAPAGSGGGDRGSFIRRVRGRLGEMVETSAICIAVTAPILAGLALPSGLPGLVANPIILPWTGVLLLPVSLIASLASLAEIPGSGLIVRVAERCAAFTLWLVSASAAHLRETGSTAPPVIWFTMLAGVGSLATVWTSRPRLRLMLTVAIVAGLGAAPTRGGDDRLPAPPRLVALDVGQGDASLVEGRSGSLLIDGGRARPGHFDAGARIVVPALRALGVRRLDLVVASHADIDHRGGLVAVLRALEVGALWLPRGGASDPRFGRLISAARDRHVPVREVSNASPTEQIGDLTIEVLWPPQRAWGASRNDDSVVLRVEVDGTRLLLTADVGGAVEAELLNGSTGLGVSVLKVGHHGSASSSSTAFLRAVAPALAILSAPCGGRAGLPSRAALARLEAAGVEIAWTGRDGAVGVALGHARRGANGSPPVRTFASKRRCIIR